MIGSINRFKRDSIFKSASITIKLKLVQVFEEVLFKSKKGQRFAVLFYENKVR